MSDEAKDVWHPDLIFLHVTDIQSLPKYGSDEKFAFWLNMKENKIDYRESLRVTVSCHFNFQDYPFDENVCDFSFGCETIGTPYFQFNPIQVLHEDGNVLVLNSSKPITNDHLPYDISIQAQAPFNLSTIGYNIPFTG